MPSQAPPPTFGTAKSKPVRPAISKAAPTRSRDDEGTESSPYVIESDDEDTHRPALVRKRNKISGVAKTARQATVPAALQTVEDESSDDEPLINRVQAQKLLAVSDAIATGSQYFFDKSNAGTSARTSQRAAATRLTSQSAFTTPARPPHETCRTVSAFGSPVKGLAPTDTPSPFSPFSQTCFPLYGEQTNLKSAFESVSKDPAQRVPAESSYGELANSIGRKRVKLSSTLRNLSQTRTHSATSQTKHASLTDQPQTPEDPFSSPSQLAASRGGQAQDHTFPVHASRRLELSEPSKSSSADAVMSSPAAAVSSVQRPTLGLSLLTSIDVAPSPLRRRVPTPERLFTNMSLSNFNKLMLAIPGIQAEEVRRSEKKKVKTSAPLKGASAKKVGPAKEPGSGRKTKANVKDVEQPKKTKMAGVDQLDFINAATSAGEADDERSCMEMGMETEGYESDGTLFKSEDELAMSETVTRTKKKIDLTLPSQAQALLDRMPAVKPRLLLKSTTAANILTASKAPVQPSSVQRAARMTPASPVVDLTNDAPRASAPSRGKPRSSATLTAPTIAAVPSQPAPSTERPHKKGSRPKASRSSEVRTSTKPAPAPPTPKIKQEHDLSPHGRISTARFNVFMHWLNGNVQAGHLFDNNRREDTLDNCLVHLNEYLGGTGEQKKLRMKEISAAFAQLEKIGDVVVEGGTVRFLYEEEKGKPKVKARKRH